MHLLMKTHRRVCQCLNQLFQCTNIPTRHQFIHTFTPLLLAELKSAHDPPPPCTIDILKAFETLLAVVDATLRTFFLTSFSQKCDLCLRLGIRLASLIIPLFFNLLPDVGISPTKANHSNDRLISYIVERIQYLIPMYSNEFRLILQTLPDLRTKLENAIRRQQQLKQQQRDEKEPGYSSKAYLSSIHASSQAPSLSLRIDFSNFKSS